jgi:ATP-dependent DNA ligase
MFVKQCKSKDIKNMSISLLNKFEFPAYISCKYDGNYVQGYFEDKNYLLYSSSGKPFKHIIMDNLFIVIREFMQEHNISKLWLEMEFIGIDGKLGDRVNSAISGCLADYKKGITCNKLGKFIIFDIFYQCNKETIEYITFDKRVNLLNSLQEILSSKNIDNLEVVENKKVNTFETIEEEFAIKCRDGYEGIIVKAYNHVHKFGKRVNNSIKYKKHNTADLLCIGIEEGEGKYKGKLGALVLTDSSNTKVRVGSGLSDTHRNIFSEDYWVGKVIEIGYLDKLDTYTQPTFITIREDKSPKEID